MPESATSRLNSIANALRTAERSTLLGRGFTVVAGVTSSAVTSFFSNDDLLRASALTYTVALSIVPILALAFSALKGFGAFDQLRPLIERSIAFGSPKITDQLMTYVDRTNTRAVGAAGAAFLLLTVISTMSNVELALNSIFRVSRSRSYLRKFSDYLSILFTVPILMVAALTMTAVVSTRLSLETAFFATISPWLLAWAGIFFLYVFFPYTHVRYDAAVIGSLAGAILFQLGQWAYVRFQIGVANYQAIYGALATLPIFLVWIYIAWSIVLFGAEVTAAIQRGGGRMNVPAGSPEFIYAAGLHILLRLADEHKHGGHPITVSTFAVELNVDAARIEPLVDRLRAIGFIIDAGEAKARNHGLVLNRAPSQIRLGDAVGTLSSNAAEMADDPRIRAFLIHLSEQHKSLLSRMTLEDLAEERFDVNAPAPVAPGIKVLANGP
jgi:membrane protein